MMKTLAARFVTSERAKKVGSIAAIGAQMVFVECGRPAVNHAHTQATAVVVDIARPSQNAKAEEEAVPEARAEPIREGQAVKAATYLDANIYPGCVVEARLSIRKPDNSLEKVVLDPSVVFSVRVQSASGASRGMAGSNETQVCAGVPECDLSDYVRMNIPLLGLETHKELRVSARFPSESGSRLPPAQTTLRVTNEELAAYCR